MRFSLTVVCAVALTAVAFAQQPAPSAPQATRPAPSLAAAGTAPDAVVVTVGSEKITRAQFEDLLSALAENGHGVPNGAARRQVAEQLGQLLAVAQEARKRKLDQSPAVKQMMFIQSEQVLANEVQKQVARDINPDEAALHAYYDAHKGEYEQVKASHILIRYKGSPVPVRPNEKDLTEEEALAKANDIEKKLAAGGDFAVIAKAESDDTGTGANGGQLPPFGRGQMVAEFEQAVFAQPVGKISEPVKTKFGYHIIKVEDHTSKTFDQSRAEIEKKLKPEMTREAMDRIEKQTPVVLDDSYFGK
jgi:peptidyl-prolyl cis-trans isomerase C